MSARRDYGQLAVGPGLLTSYQKHGAEKAEVGGLTRDTGLKREMVKNDP